MHNYGSVFKRCASFLNEQDVYVHVNVRGAIRKLETPFIAPIMAAFIDEYIPSRPFLHVTR